MYFEKWNMEENVEFNGEVNVITLVEAHKLMIMCDVYANACMEEHMHISALLI